MRKITVLIVVSLIGLPWLNCGNNSPSRKEVSVASFSPPPDTSITQEQFSAWFACGRPLDSLSRIYADSFAAAYASESSQRSFLSTQDRICVNEGLRAGYREYRWIMENLGTERNRKLYDSLKRRVRDTGS